MKVRARHWIKTNSGWHQTGEVFEVENADGLTGMVDILEEATQQDAVPDIVEETVPADEPKAAKKRSRKQTGK